MTKFHISKDGVARQCCAQKIEACKATPSDQKEHYDTKEDAQNAYEKAHSTFPSKKPQRSKTITSNIFSEIKQKEKYVEKLQSAIEMFGYDDMEGKEYLDYNNLPAFSNVEEIEQEIIASNIHKEKLENESQENSKPTLHQKVRTVEAKKNKVVKTDKDFDIYKEYYSVEDTQKTLQHLGNVKNIQLDNNAISFYIADNEYVSFSTAGDCCSTSVIENVNVKPIDSPIKNISFYKTLQEDAVNYKRLDDVMQISRYVVEYDNGKKQYFDDVNHSNGYYGSMNGLSASFKI